MKSLLVHLGKTRLLVQGMMSHLVLQRKNRLLLGPQ
jgi:hypothetical protein